jgi:AcrR family transcriptional regulator
MAIIVDKAQKRKDIALACKELFVQNSISTLTISKIAQVAGVGKGTLYEYFKNKEEIVFELVDLLLQEYSAQLQEKLSKEKSVKNKVKKFAEFFYKDENRELRALYKDFVSISLVSPNEEMRAFQTACFNNYYLWVVELFEEGVKRGELIEASLGLIKGVFVTAEGMFVASCTTNVFENLEKDLNEYIENLFNIIEVKK